MPRELLFSISQGLGVTNAERNTYILHDNKRISHNNTQLSAEWEMISESCVYVFKYYLELHCGYCEKSYLCYVIGTIYSSKVLFMDLHSIFSKYSNKTACVNNVFNHSLNKEGYIKHP